MVRCPFCTVPLDYPRAGETFPHFETLRPSDQGCGKEEDSEACCRTSTSSLLYTDMVQLHALATHLIVLTSSLWAVYASDCSISPAGEGLGDDQQVRIQHFIDFLHATGLSELDSQIYDAVEECGTDGSITLEEGTYNITQ